MRCGASLTRVQATNVTSERPDDLDELQALFETLREDARDLLERINETGDQAFRRSAVRAVFALIEGVVFSLKQVALNSERSSGATFSPAERALLNEESYRLADSGIPEVKQDFSPLPRSLRFAFDALRKATGSEYQLEIEDEGWKAFRNLIQVRNRITHPKRSSDLEVVDEEVKLLKQTYSWFVRCFGLALIGAIRALRQAADDIRRRSGILARINEGAGG